MMVESYIPRQRFDRTLAAAAETQDRKLRCQRVHNEGLVGDETQDEGRNSKSGELRGRRLREKV